ncbi:hypothetical protein V6N12_044840 [Hibiscus sabdariffa]|uniref:Ubiquitin-like domain-containing protein n=1 Tax=Hibiscus sabdariffa TaxID=183260 RepID=A0ABR2BB28_9ROSI
MSHLDGRQLLIKSQPGEVVKPDQFKAINDEGMPIYQRASIQLTDMELDECEETTLHDVKHGGRASSETGTSSGGL